MTDEFNESVVKTRNCISTIFNRFYVWKTLQNNDYSDIYKKDNGFWVAVIDCLKDGFLIELAKIFEENNERNDVLSITYLIKLIPEGIKKEEIKSELKKYDKTIINLKKWRDKILAHRERKYILNSGKISSKYPLKNNEIESLMKLLEKILGMIETTKTGKGIVYCFREIERESQTDTNNIVKILRKGYDYKKKELAEELKQYREVYESKR